MSHKGYAIPMSGGGVLALGPAPLVMGIVNVTPDSFSDGGDFFDPATAITHGKSLVDAGADILDIGGESTRPGADEVTAQQELDRVLPVLSGLIAEGVNLPLSIDTYKAVVADQAVQSGATLLNDVYGLQREPEMADIAALYDVPVIAMHWDKQRDNSKDLLAEMLRYFERTLEIADNAGVAREKLILDPGFGFGKDVRENYELLGRLKELAVLDRPLLIGTSRKRMIGNLLDVPPKERDLGTAVTSALAYERGGHIFRVHDVTASRQALQVAGATLYGPPELEG